MTAVLVVSVVVGVLLLQEIFDRRLPGESWARRVGWSVIDTLRWGAGFAVGIWTIVFYPAWIVGFGLWSALRSRSAEPLVGIGVFVGVMAMAALGLALWHGGIALVIASGYGPVVGLALAALVVGAAWQSVRLHRS